MADEFDSDEFHRNGLRLIAWHYNSEGFLDVDYLAAALRASLARARETGRDVELPPELVELIAKHLAGELPARRGRRLRLSDHSWVRMITVRGEFVHRRANGEGYDALVAEFAEENKVSKKTIESWLSPGK
jgi:hypothetical protein